MAILPIPAVGAAGSTSAASALTGLGASTNAGAAATQGAATHAAGSFGNVAAQAIDSLQQTQAASDAQALAASTGQGNPADVMIAATEASLQTQLTVAVRDKAVDAFNQIMGMQF
jgi:flagellar hook-basal body complex protein FliE